MKKKTRKYQRKIKTLNNVEQFDGTFDDFVNKAEKYKGQIFWEEDENCPYYNLEGTGIKLKKQDYVVVSDGVMNIYNRDLCILSQNKVLNDSVLSHWSKVYKKKT